ncbi:MAG: tripartite tricarboxylate transporter TctB family protein [Alphaproteobacteria bacterium]|nr:tripartite tricarboxylate transporter TctB family protein [Alphaproteobacteria bacterium]
MSEATTPAGAPPGQGRRTGAVDAIWAGRGVAALFAATGLFAGWTAVQGMRHDPDPGTWLLPLTTGILCVALAAVVGIDGAGVMVPWRIVTRRASAMALLLVYVGLLLPILGFVAGSVLLVIAVGAACGGERGFVIVGGLLLVSVMWALFAYGLTEPLPAALWGR